MNKDTYFATALLKTKGLTNVLVNKDSVYVSRQRGVAPLLECLEGGKDFSGYCAADKVIGKAAAYLYVLLDVKEVYAVTASIHAAEVFKRYGISFICENTVSAIKNRDGNGLCPMESAVMDIDTPEAALKAIKEKLSELKSK